MKLRVASICLVLAVPAAAQIPPGPPVLPPEKSIPLVLAIEAAQAAIDNCLPRKSAATAEVVDLNGLTKVVLSADGARTNSFEYARRKAYTVLKKQMSSGDFGKSLGPIAPNAPPIEGDPNLTQYGGALPIMRGAVMIGTISVSGPTGQVDDELCARAGLDKIKARL